MNRQANFGKLFLRPLLITAIVAAAAIGYVVGYGEALLAVVDHSIEKNSLARPEIWVAVIPAAIIVILATLIAYSPAGRFGFLEKQTLFGKEPLFAPAAPGPSVLAKRGVTGRASDVAAGWSLYANDVPLGRVVGIVPGRRGEGAFLFTNGFAGQPRQIWVPMDAVNEVYPETRSAFLRMRGLDAAAYGWTTMPESVKPVRGQ
ncbi:MAG TPA: hypothetical protein VGT61_15640 [Thermomicrobiales bacterium]|nr:hypothetical protein [Thermomicrobiales bacterium]